MFVKVNDHSSLLVNDNRERPPSPFPQSSYPTLVGLSGIAMDITMIFKHGRSCQYTLMIYHDEISLLYVVTTHNNAISFRYNIMIYRDDAAT